MATPAPLTTPLPETPSKALIPKQPWIMRFGKWAQPRVNAIVARASLVGDSPFHDKADFPWVAELEANWPVIRAEAEACCGDLAAIPPLAEISPDHRRIAPAGKWRSFFLWGYGYSVPENCARAPVTAALVERIPGLNTALFSVLAPGTHIPAHTGVTKAILVCHLGVRVPRDRERCTIRVVDRHVSWEEGKAFVFDDVYNHEVLNDTDEVRIVLLVQFRRPVRPFGRAIGNLFLWSVKHSRFVQDARRGVAAWVSDRGAE